MKYISCELGVRVDLRVSLAGIKEVIPCKNMKGSQVLLLALHTELMVAFMRLNDAHLLKVKRSIPTTMDELSIRPDL